MEKSEGIMNINEHIIFAEELEKKRFDIMMTEFSLSYIYGKSKKIIKRFYALDKPFMKAQSVFDTRLYTEYGDDIDSNILSSFYYCDSYKIVYEENDNDVTIRREKRSQEISRLAENEFKKIFPRETKRVKKMTKEQHEFLGKKITTAREWMSASWHQMMSIYGADSSEVKAIRDIGRKLEIANTELADLYSDEYTGSLPNPHDNGIEYGYV